jgi:hypothetical protein
MRQKVSLNEAKTLRPDGEVYHKNIFCQGLLYKINVSGFIYYVVIFSKLYFKHFAVYMKYCKEIVGNNFNTL